MPAADVSIAMQNFVHRLLEIHGLALTAFKSSDKNKPIISKHKFLTTSIKNSRIFRSKTDWKSEPKDYIPLKSHADLQSKTWSDQELRNTLVSHTNKSFYILLCFFFKEKQDLGWQKEKNFQAQNLVLITIIN